MNKSSVKEIKERFDNDVERFSNLDTGQVTTIDAKISLELLTEAAKRINSSKEVDNALKEIHGKGFAPGDNSPKTLYRKGVVINNAFRRAGLSVADRKKALAICFDSGLCGEPKPGENIADFLFDFPSYPFKNELKKDYLLANKNYYPIRKANKWGFVNKQFKTVIAPIYDWVSNFQEGVAVAMLGQKRLSQMQCIRIAGINMKR